MPTTIISIDLPEDLYTFVLEQVKEGRYSNPSEYFCDLIRAYQKRQAEEKKARLRQDLQDGINSGFEPLDMDAIKAEARRRNTEQHKGSSDRTE